MYVVKGDVVKHRYYNAAAAHLWRMEAVAGKQVIQPNIRQTHPAADHHKLLEADNGTETIRILLRGQEEIYT